MPISLSSFDDAGRRATGHFIATFQTKVNEMKFSSIYIFGGSRRAGSNHYSK
ncbi:hypothetical protein [Paracoccus yeei]|uniref:hypothetical protein n=1 Tax=Paracoccus yeei TaxID=147645 RepID=UPI0039EEACB2